MSAVLGSVAVRTVRLGSSFGGDCRGAAGFRSGTAVGERFVSGCGGEDEPVGEDLRVAGGESAVGVGFGEEGLEGDLGVLGGVSGRFGDKDFPGSWIG